MRAVVWTDTVQALMLIVGIGGMLIAVLPGLEGMAATSYWIIENEPHKAAVPEGGFIRTWISTLVLVCFSASIYPQAIQRIFAAKSSRSLRNSLSVMAFLPFVTVLPILLVGFLSIPEMRTTDGIDADRVLPDLIQLWAGQSLFLYAMAVLVLTGTIAAIMSTADSMLLSLSSIVAKDVLAKTWLQKRDAAAPDQARQADLLGRHAGADRNRLHTADFPVGPDRAEARNSHSGSPALRPRHHVAPVHRDRRAGRSYRRRRHRRRLQLCRLRQDLEAGTRASSRLPPTSPSARC